MNSFSVILILLLSSHFNQCQNEDNNLIENNLFREIRGPMTSEDRKTCHNQFKESQGPNSDTGLSIDELLVVHGYPVDRINVRTDDGYILGLFRIPYSPRSPLVEGMVKKAVILNHGLGGNGLSWLIQHGPRNLAMFLADSGFDVFISNARGSSYSQGHDASDMTLNNEDYWEFSFHEMGIYDLPAVIETITNLTRNQAMYYVGHSMGTTSLSVMLAEKPEYNTRILTAFLLAPSIYFGHTMKPLQWLFRYSFYYQFFLRPIMGGKMEGFKPIEDLMRRKAGFLCSTERAACNYCANGMFMSVGYDGPQMNYTTLGILLGAVDAMSTKTMTHYAQLIKSDEFCQFNYGMRSINKQKYGRSTPPCYNLENISAPIVMFWGENDSFAKPQNVVKTVSRFPKGAVKEVNRVNWSLFNHNDFIIAKDADTLIYHHILKVMNNATYE